MNSLTTAPVAPLVAHLFAQAEAADRRFLSEIGVLPPQEQDALLRTANYRDLYGRAKDAFLAVSPETGQLLYMLARASRARSIVEFGTSFGLSTLHLAAALKDNGGGRLIGTEFEPRKVEQARAHIAQAGLSAFVELRAGDALETLSKDLPDEVDFLLLDGAKALYPRILALVEPRLVPGALIVADNADHCPDYVAEVRAPGSGYLSVAVTGDVELSQWLGAA